MLKKVPNALKDKLNNTDVIKDPDISDMTNYTDKITF